METFGLSLTQLLALAALALVGVLIVLLALKVLARVGGAMLKIGCVLLTLLLLLAGCYLTWTALQGRG
ncbi:MAG TPA: hypothetical protein ENI39_07680 [Anaerolineae bacterium]|nr:hypothetical protein [Anaerolineae bacterium]HEC36397.1 hypothetical protein [Anaerolineae bacterium]